MNPNWKEVNNVREIGKYFFIDGFPFNKVRPNEYRCKYYRVRGSRKVT